MSAEERAVALQALARAYPGDTTKICELAPTTASRADCTRINERPHLRDNHGQSPPPSERTRASPGPATDRLPVPEALSVTLVAGERPDCTDETCLAERARHAAMNRDWAGVLGACRAISAEKWQEDCYFQSAEAATRKNGASVYTEASQLCSLAAAWRAQCQAHLANELNTDPDGAVPAIERTWSHTPQFMTQFLDLYWSEHAMAVFGGRARPSREAIADRYFRMERAMSVPKEVRSVRPLWPKDEPGEERFPAMRFRAVGRRAYDEDPAIDQRICALEAEATRSSPDRAVFEVGLGDPVPVVRWTATRLLVHFAPSSPALLALADDPDSRVAARARSARTLAP